MATTYVVTGPYVTVKVNGADGTHLLGYYAGAVLPEGVDEDALKHHLDAGLVAPVKDAEKELAAQPGELPSNTGSVSGEPVPGEPVEKPARSSRSK